MPWDFWLILLFLSVVLPLRGRQRIKKLTALAEVSGAARIRLYLSTILFQWLLTVLVAWRALERGMSFSEMGFLRWTLLTVLLAAIGSALIAAVHWINLRRMANSEHPAIQRLRELGSRLFPRSTTELAIYILLALTAGFCEEFIFRGFVMAVLLRAGLAAWVVVLLSSLMFGIAHLYQGKGGSGGTTLVGVLFAVVRITYHSLIPVIAWHAALDIAAGLAGRKYITTSSGGGGPVTPQSVAAASN